MRDCRTPWRLYVGISSWSKSNSLGDVSGSTYHFHAFRSGSLEVLSLINIRSIEGEVRGSDVTQCHIVSAGYTGVLFKKKLYQQNTSSLSLSSLFFSQEHLENSII